MSRYGHVLLPVARCERSTSLPANAVCGMRANGHPRSFMPAPGCSPWRPQSEPTTSCDVVTDGGGGADMRRASNRLIGWRSATTFQTGAPELDDLRARSLGG